MSGFVYIWRDKKHNRYYIGSHWGTEDDGYICSSNWMKMSYKRRPYDFKRRILARVDSSRIDLIEEEFKWISMIKKEESGKRYYNFNLKNKNLHLFEQRESIAQKISKALTGKKFQGDLAARNEKIGHANKGKKRSQDMKDNMSKKMTGRKQSEEVISNRINSIKERYKITPRKKLSPESIERMRKSLTGRKIPPDVLERRRKSQTGAKRSPEACLRISEGKRLAKLRKMNT